MRADDASASQTTSEEYAAFGQVSDSRAPKALRAEGYTEIVLWRSLNVVRRCYPGPGVVTVIGVIRYSDNSVIEITLVGTYCIQYSSRERNSGSSKLVVWAVAYRAVENRKEDEAPVAPSKDT